MPSSLHEALIEMFRNRPSLAAELLVDALGVAVPAYQQARLESGDFADLVPAEYRADAVVVLADAGAPVLAVVVEVQLRRDRHKRWSWPVYVCTLRARLRCPTVLLVLCVDEATAAWCASPIELGHPGARLCPVVLGPARVPVVTDAELAGRAPELAVLSAMAHGSRPEREDVLDALLRGLATLDEDRAGLYCDVVLAALPAAARSYLEALMTTRAYEYQSDFARRYFFEGKAEGEAEGEATGKAVAVLTVLDARGVVVPGEWATRIRECTDPDQLDVWLRRAVVAHSVDELLGRGH